MAALCPTCNNSRQMRQPGFMARYQPCPTCCGGFAAEALRTERHILLRQTNGDFSKTIAAYQGGDGDLVIPVEGAGVIRVTRQQAVDFFGLHEPLRAGCL